MTTETETNTTTNSHSCIADRPDWMNVRVGDECIVRSEGMARMAVCGSIVRLSCGKTLMVMNNAAGESIGIYNAMDVMLLNRTARELKLTVFDELLRRYEPKGTTTNHSTLY